MTDEKKELPCKESKNGLHFPSGQDVAAAIGFDHRCAHCKKYYNDADNFLPVSPSKLPWEYTCRDCEGSIVGRYVSIPEPEAKQLFELRQKIEVERLNTWSIVHSLLIAEIRALQERVKKFELAAATMIDLYDSHALDVVATMDKRFSAKIGGIMKLLRDAMGEK